MPTTKTKTKTKPATAKPAAKKTKPAKVPVKPLSVPAPFRNKPEKVPVDMLTDFLKPVRDYGEGVSLVSNLDISIASIANAFPQDSALPEAIREELVSGVKLQQPLLGYLSVATAAEQKVMGMTAVKVMIVDGRHRRDAVQNLVTSRLADFDLRTPIRTKHGGYWGNFAVLPVKIFPDAQSAVGYALSANLNRRHLTTKQLAALAVSLYDNRIYGSLDKVAKAVGVSMRSLSRYRARQGITNPAKVESGKVAAAARHSSAPVADAPSAPPPPVKSPQPITEVRDNSVRGNVIDARSTTAPPGKDKREWAVGLIKTSSEFFSDNAQNDESSFHEDIIRATGGGFLDAPKDAKLAAWQHALKHLDAATKTLKRVREFVGKEIAAVKKQKR